MKVRKENSRLIKPIYEGNPPPTCLHTPLTVFDSVTYNTHMAVIYAFKPPTPATAVVEQGLQIVLGVYREWAGRLGRDAEGSQIILLNDEGVRFIEALAGCSLDQAMPLKPSPALLSLHPPLKGVEELVQVQLTRFTCGSLVLGFTAHHLVADGLSTSDFLIAWGKASRKVDIGPLPMCNREIFSPRCPPKVDFEHRGVEFIDKRLRGVAPLEPLVELCEDNDVVVVHKVHFTIEFLAKLKAKASSSTILNRGSGARPFSTFESLVAHLWRAITRARGLNGFETSHIRISVNGRPRLNPQVPNEYFGNLVLWAFPSAKAKDLLAQPLGFAAKVIQDAVAKVNDDYFKSFIDFASTEAGNMAPTADMSNPVLCPNLEVDSWLRFPFYDLDFGGGSPYIFMPSYFPVEGMLFLLPSFIGDGSIDAIVPLFQNDLFTFKQICYSLD